MQLDNTTRGKIFELFLSGKTVVEVNKLTGLHYDRVQTYYASFIANYKEAVEMYVPNRINQIKAIEAELFARIEQGINDSKTADLVMNYCKFCV